MGARRGDDVCSVHTLMENNSHLENMDLGSHEPRGKYGHLDEKHHPKDPINPATNSQKVKLQISEPDESARTHVGLSNINCKTQSINVSNEQQDAVQIPDHRSAHLWPPNPAICATEGDSCIIIQYILRGEDSSSDESLPDLDVRVDVADPPEMIDPDAPMPIFGILRGEPIPLVDLQIAASWARLSPAYQKFRRSRYYRIPEHN